MVHALEDMWNSGSSFLKHQNWSIWWKNTAQRAKYAHRDFETEKDFWLFDFLTKNNPPKYDSRPIKTLQALKDI